MIVWFCCVIMTTAPWVPLGIVPSCVLVVSSMSASCDPLNISSLETALDALPAHWLRHFARGSVSAQQQLQTYSGLKGWGRTRFTIRKGRLHYTPHSPTGCVLRRTPILAWALL